MSKAIAIINNHIVQSIILRINIADSVNSRAIFLSKIEGKVI